MINEGGSGLNETAFILTKFSQVSVLGLLLSQLTCSMPNGIIWILNLQNKNTANCNHIHIRCAENKFHTIRENFISVSC